MSDQPAEPQDPQAPSSAVRQWLQKPLEVARQAKAWLAANRLRGGLVIGACLLSVTGVTVGLLLIGSDDTTDDEVTLDMAFGALDRGALVRARELTEEVQARGTLAVDQWGGPAFVMGAAACLEADDSWSQQKTEQYLVAARYLEEARDRGFPPGREAQGLYLLGRSLYLSGQIPESILVLLEAVEQHTQTASHTDSRWADLHQLLAGAYLHDANPQLEEALAANAIYLAEEDLPADVRNAGLIERAQILLRLNRPAECRVALEQLPPDAENRAEAMVLYGRLLIDQARMLSAPADAPPEDRQPAEAKYEEAIHTLRQAQGIDTLTTQATRKAMYLIGVCLLEMGRDREALSQFVRTAKMYGKTSEGVAASFQEAELRRKAGEDTEALAAYNRILETLTDPHHFSNPWITLEQLREQTRQFHQHYLTGGKFEIALQMARSFDRLYSSERSLELIAEAYRRWGQSLLDRAAEVTGEQAESLKFRGREQFRRAGLVYGRRARLLIATRRYPEELFNAGDAFFRGQDYVSAIRMLTQYIENDPRGQRPEAIVRLGEAYLNHGDTEKALEQFQECLESHPHHEAVFRARVLGARAHVDRGETEEAKTLLLKNLDGQEIAPDSREYRDSLFALGELLYLAGEYDKAQYHLEYEAVLRYPDDPRTPVARFRIADCYRQLADAAREKLVGEPQQIAHVVHSRKSMELYGEALTRFVALRDALRAEQEGAALGPLEQRILRNCTFAVGEVEFALGQFEAAVRTYTAVADRYQDQPVALEAFVRIADAYVRLDQPGKARATLEQAKLVLKLIRDEPRFVEETNYTPEQWAQRLDELLWLRSF